MHGGESNYPRALSIRYPVRRRVGRCFNLDQSMHDLGGKVTTPTNEYFIRAKSYFDPAEDGDVQLTVGEGLGLLQDCVIEVHFSEIGGFPRLVSAMELTKSTYGFGIDEPTCLEIREREFVRVYGRGRAYALKRTGSLRFEVQILEPGDEFEMRKA